MSDPRIRRGMQRQLEERRRLLSGGHRPLGWKAGFGAPSAQEKLHLQGPLLGFMTDASALSVGAEVAVDDWTRPIAEPEVAVWIGEDLAGDGDPERVRRAISAVSPAVELADIDPPPEEVEEILAANVFHRGVIFGDRDATRAGAHLDGLKARVVLGGEPVEAPTGLEELTGDISSVVAHMSSVLADHGESIRAGEVVICGSVVPALPLVSGTTVEFELAPFSPITVHTA